MARRSGGHHRTRRRLNERHRQHLNAAKKISFDRIDNGVAVDVEPQALGFYAVMHAYGPDAFTRRIVDTFPPISNRTDLPKCWQPWADAEEVRLIDENGGVMRYFSEEDDDHFGDQTFNLTPGGQCNASGAQKRWEAIWANSQAAWLRFKKELEAYAAENNGSMAPPFKYVNRKTGYALGRDN